MEETQSFAFHPHLSSSCNFSTLQSSPPAMPSLALNSAETLLRSTDLNSESTVSAIKSSIDGHDRASAAAISALSSLFRSCTNEEGFSLLSSVLNEELLLSLVSSEKYAVRSRVLELLVLVIEKSKGGCNFLRDEVLIRVFLGFMGDIYPILRRNGTDGLYEVLSVTANGVNLCVVDKSLEKAIVLLKDDDELVRSSAVKLLGLCGEIISQRENKEDNIEQTNTIFIQICLMCRDMSMKVRKESFKALAKLKLVSESVLIQSLSKKLLGAKKDKSIIIKEEGFKFKPYFSSAHGAFIHGIEDEFYQIRLEASKSLGKLSLSSIKFADGSLNLLMDMINDDYELVRIEALNSLYNLAKCGFLTLQEKTRHMFEGLLMDHSREVRNVSRNIIRLVKFPKLENFKSIIDDLITNLDKYPQEEEDIFMTLFSLGKNHTKFSLKLAKDMANQIEKSRKEELMLDRPGVWCTVVLSIASPFYNKQLACDMPAELFNYAVPLFIKISKALNSTIDRDSLLSFLLERANIEYIKSVPLIDGSEFLSDEFRYSVESILRNIGFIWPLVKSRSEYDVRRVLRACKEELEMLYLDASNSMGAIVEFILEYVKIMQLITEIWCTTYSGISNSFGMRNLYILLEKLDASIRKIRFGFTDLTKELEFRIIELSLLLDLLKLSMVIKGNSDQILKNIQAKISHLESISSISEFVKEVKNSIDKEDSCPIQLFDLLELFYFQELKIDWEIKSIKAKLEVIGNDSENPIPFISGLPVGIKFQITLYNTSNNNKLWLKMNVSGIFTQFVYLDLDRFDGSDEVRECRNFIIPLYRTAKVTSFEIRVCIVMECLSKDNELLEEKQGGPSYEFIELCDDCVVYFVSMENKS